MRSTGFDEKKYGFASVVDLMRAAGKENVVRIERDRQGAVRVFAGPKLTEGSAAVPADAEVMVVEPVTEPPIVEAETIEEPLVAGVVDTEAPRKGTRRRRPAAAKSKDGGRALKAARPRARKTARGQEKAAGGD